MIYDVFHVNKFDFCVNSTSIHLAYEMTLFLRLFSFISDKFFQNAVKGFGYNLFDFLCGNIFVAIVVYFTNMHQMFYLKLFDYFGHQRLSNFWLVY